MITANVKNEVQPKKTVFLDADFEYMDSDRLYIDSKTIETDDSFDKRSLSPTKQLDELQSKSK
jgi:hypothetical protein